MSMMGMSMSQTAVGDTVAEYNNYEAAQAAVSKLIAGEVPAREIAIVGRGIRSIERVTGKLGYATAARTGAINGLFLGLLFGALFGLGNPQPQMQIFFGAMLVGVAIGMIMSIVSYWIIRRRRDYASVMQLVADHYEVTVAASSIHSARAILGTARTAHRAPEPVDLSRPPQFGVRIADKEAAAKNTTAPVPPVPAQPAEEAAAAASRDASDEKGAPEGPDAPRS